MIVAYINNSSPPEVITEERHLLEGTAVYIDWFRKHWAEGGTMLIAENREMLLEDLKLLGLELDDDNPNG